jgi:hypothetical protein
MNRTAVLLVAGLLLVAGAWFALRGAPSRLDPTVAQFHRDADNLIVGLQQYKEFFKSYPAGDHIQIAKSLSGQTDQKVLILVTGKNQKNAKGEIVDPWGTPLQFYFAQNGVLIRSAGPNRVFEDSTVAGADDLYRTETK